MNPVKPERCVCEHRLLSITAQETTPPFPSIFVRRSCAIFPSSGEGVESSQTMAFPRGQAVYLLSLQIGLSSDPLSKDILKTTAASSSSIALNLY